MVVKFSFLKEIDNCKFYCPRVPLGLKENVAFVCI